MDYQDTPSFYNNEEYFNNYLGCTSYYTALQNVVSKIIGFVEPKNVLEMGSALGTTTNLLAEQYTNVNFTGIDIRRDIVEEAIQLSKGRSNVHFLTADMCEYAKRNLYDYDLIFLLYSFHHILDPLENKEIFLEDCFKNMKANSYLLIAETFLPDGITVLKEDPSISKLFTYRSEEGYASTFWAALENISSDGISLAREVANVSRSEEWQAGLNVNIRKDEYLIEFSWLISQAEKHGFEVVIAEPVNSLMEKAILLRR